MPPSRSPARRRPGGDLGRRRGRNRRDDRADHAAAGRERARAHPDGHSLPARNGGDGGPRAREGCRLRTPLRLRPALRPRLLRRLPRRWPQRLPARRGLRARPRALRGQRARQRHAPGRASADGVRLRRGRLGAPARAAGLPARQLRPADARCDGGRARRLRRDRGRLHPAGWLIGLQRRFSGKTVLVVGEVVAGRYELEELVGTGGMSSVFKARDRLLERRVALKVLHQHYTDDEEYVERFRREARVVAQLSHPNIVTVIDRGEDEGRQFIVFELVEGRTLKELLEEEGRLPVQRALEIALQVARGLAFAHEHGLVHRDVKPQNVILNGDGRAKVTDFGIARSLDVQGVTQSGAVLGTSNYIAPEQASGRPV